MNRVKSPKLSKIGEVSTAAEHVPSHEAPTEQNATIISNLAMVKTDREMDTELNRITMTNVHRATTTMICVKESNHAKTTTGILAIIGGPGEMNRRIETTGAVILGTTKRTRDISQGALIETIVRDDALDLYLSHHLDIAIVRGQCLQHQGNEEYRGREVPKTLIDTCRRHLTAQNPRKGPLEKKPIGIVITDPVNPTAIASERRDLASMT